MDTKESKPDLGKEVVAASTQDFPPGMAPKMLNLMKVLSDLEKDLQPLISQPYHEVLNKLKPLERAKVGMMEIYTINLLLWVLMKTSNESAEEKTMRDDWKVEMGRLRDTQTRLSEVEARPNRNQVDKAAAARFIQRGLGISNKRQHTDDDDDS